MAAMDTDFLGCRQIAAKNCAGLLRPSRRALRALLRMTYVFDGIKKECHPEEPAQRASRRTHSAPAPIVLSLLLAVPAAAAETISEPVALLQGLDKTTARISKFTAPVGTAVRFGTLSILVRDCEKTPPEAPPENGAFVEITESRPGEPDLRLFQGWMFASSPALSALEHPVYDVNLLDCRAASGPPSGAADAGNTAGKTAR